MSAAREPLWLRWWVADALIMLCCALAIGLAFVLAPGAERVALLGFEVPELCAVKRLMGYPCPGCGLTRSWVYLAHGDWRSAFSMNLLGPVLFVAAALLIPQRGLRLLRQHRARRRAARTSEQSKDQEEPCPA